MTQPYVAITTGHTGNLTQPARTWNQYTYRATNMVSVGVRTSEPQSQFYTIQHYIANNGTEATIQIMNSQNDAVTFQLTVVYLVPGTGQASATGEIVFEKVGGGPAT